MPRHARSCGFDGAGFEAVGCLLSAWLGAALHLWSVWLRRPAGGVVSAWVGDMYSFRRRCRETSRVTG